jgi:hypothetical protein
VQGLYDAKDGSQIEYKGVVPFKFRMNPDTKQLEPKVEVDPKTGQVNDPLNEIVSSVDPELWKGYMKQIVGFGQMFNPDYTDHAKDFINSTLGGAVSYSVKADAIKRNTDKIELGIKTQDLESKTYKNTAEYRAWEKDIEDQKLRNSTMTANASAQNANIANQRFGLSLKQYKLEMADKGYIEQPDGSLVYNPSNDKRGDDSGDPSGLRMSSGTSVFIKKDFNGNKIKAVLGNQDGSLTLLKEVGNGKVVVKGKDIDRFLNQLNEKERTSVNKILKNISGGSQQSQATTKVDVSNIFNQPE